MNTEQSWYLAWCNCIGLLDVEITRDAFVNCATKAMIQSEALKVISLFVLARK